MDEYLNARCKICGELYHVCNTCKDSITFTPWRSLTDTMNHYKIFIIIRDYINKYIDKSEAKKQLENCDLAGLDTFVVEIKDAINEILKTDKCKSLKKNKDI